MDIKTLTAINLCTSIFLFFLGILLLIKRSYCIDWLFNYRRSHGLSPSLKKVRIEVIAVAVMLLVIAIWLIAITVLMGRSLHV